MIYQMIKIFTQRHRPYVQTNMPTHKLSTGQTVMVALFKRYCVFTGPKHDEQINVEQW